MAFTLKDGDILDTANLKPYLSPKERATHKLILFHGKWIKVRKNNTSFKNSTE